MGMGAITNPNLGSGIGGLTSMQNSGISGVNMSSNSANFNIQGTNGKFESNFLNNTFLSYSDNKFNVI